MLEEICAPAFIYFVFSSTQVIIDFTRGMYNTALVKLLVTFLITILLNYLCASGLSVIAWFIVFIPFILMTLIISILLYTFGLDPKSGKINIRDESLYSQLNQQQQYPDPRRIYSLSPQDTHQSKPEPHKEEPHKISKQRKSKQVNQLPNTSSHDNNLINADNTMNMKDMNRMNDMNSPFNRALRAGNEAEDDFNDAKDNIRDKVINIKNKIPSL
jgi:hypothetical protein